MYAVNFNLWFYMQHPLHIYRQQHSKHLCCGLSSKHKILNEHNGQERLAIKFILVRLKHSELRETCSNQEFKGDIL